MRIVAIDFETANGNICSACSLGLAIYEDGELLDNYEFLIKPHPRYFYFTNTFIHHLSASDYGENEKEFIEYYDKIKELLEDNVVIAHNAAFDVSVLNSVCTLYGLDTIRFQYADTVQIARKAYPELYNHKLNTCCQYLGIELDHHRAGSDAFGCLMILLKAMEAYGDFEFYDFSRHLKIGVKENV